MIPHKYEIIQSMRNSGSFWRGFGSWPNWFSFLCWIWCFACCNTFFQQGCFFRLSLFAMKLWVSICVCCCDACISVESASAAWGRPFPCPSVQIRLAKLADDPSGLNARNNLLTRDTRSQLLTRGWPEGRWKMWTLVLRSTIPSLFKEKWCNRRVLDRLWSMETGWVTFLYMLPQCASSWVSQGRRKISRPLMCLACFIHLIYITMCLDGYKKFDKDKLWYVSCKLFDFSFGLTGRVVSVLFWLG